jgi:hypothetical protein
MDGAIGEEAGGVTHMRWHRGKGYERYASFIGEEGNRRDSMSFVG